MMRITVDAGSLGVVDFVTDDSDEFMSKLEAFTILGLNPRVDMFHVDD